MNSSLRHLRNVVVLGFLLLAGALLLAPVTAAASGPDATPQPAPAAAVGAAPAPVACATQPGANTSDPSLFVAAYERNQGQVALGCATNTAHWWQGLVVQDFGGGQFGNAAIFHDENKHEAMAYILWGRTLDLYVANPQWGPPVADMEQAPVSPFGTAGSAATFNGLAVFDAARLERPSVLRGVTQTKFNALGSTGGLLGFPLGNGQFAAKSPAGVEGYYQTFEGGTMYTFYRNGEWSAYAVAGAIQAKHNAIGGSGSALGFPVGDEKEALASAYGTQGRFQEFESGHIYAPSSGALSGSAFVVSGAILPLYLGSGGPAGTLGFPVSDDFGCLSVFENGSIKCDGAVRVGVEAKAAIEGDYLLSTQYRADPAHPGYGILNNVFSPLATDPQAWSWIVPRENGMAILGLVLASELTGSGDYRMGADLVAEALVRLQQPEGYWYNQYRLTVTGFEPAPDNNGTGRSPTQTAEVMMALHKLGYEAASDARKQAMQKGAEWLLTKAAYGSPQGDWLLIYDPGVPGRFWTHDNAYAYWALVGAADWAGQSGDAAASARYAAAARGILAGIDAFLYDANAGAWRRYADLEAGVPRGAGDGAYDWINYAPQMLDLPARGVGSAVVGQWMHATLQQGDGAVVASPAAANPLKSPGSSFQAALAWLDLGQPDFAASALDWTGKSQLWCLPGSACWLENSRSTGGWVDWVAANPAGGAAERAPSWQRFTDTSFYAMAAWSGGYSFAIPFTGLPAPTVASTVPPTPMLAPAPLPTTTPTPT